MPIVNLNRRTLVGGVLAGLLLQQPLVTTALLALLLPAVLFGRRASLIFRAGKWLLASRLAGAEREDRRLQRFNNAIAVTLLGGAQIAFALGQPLLGWTLSLAVALAAGVALMGSCVGCFLYYQFKLNRYRLFGH
ncbi:MAG: DUF4395 family protein [Bacillota bacterium]